MRLEECGISNCSTKKRVGRKELRGSGKYTPSAVAESAAVAATLSAEEATEAAYESALEAMEAAAEVYGLATVEPYWSAEEATELAKEVAELTMDCQPCGERLPYSFSYCEASACAEAMAAAALTSALWMDSSQV